MTQTLNRVAENLYRSNQSGKYYCIIKRGGRQIKASLKTSDPEVAKRKLEPKIRELEHVRENKKNGTFADLLKDYKETIQASKNLKPNSLSDETTRINSLLREFSGLETKKVRDITEADCDRWFGRRVRQVAPQRINNEMNLLKEMLRLAVREGYSVSNPAEHLERVRVPKTKFVPPTKAQFQTLVDTMRASGNDDGADFVELLAYSGMRRNEAANIIWAEVDFDADRFWVTGGDEGVKGHDECNIPLFPALRDLLLRIKAKRGNVKPTDKIMRIKQCKDGIWFACDRAKLPRFDHHDMRRFFASNAVENGIDFKTLAGWLRHKDGGILAAQTYSFLRKDHSDELAKQMDYSATDSEGKIVPMRKEA